MYKTLFQAILSLKDQTAPPLGIGLFRALYGLVALQEILFLLYFNHLIFDPIPYLDVEFPLIPFFLILWGISAFCLCIGYHCQTAALICYAFWIIFVQFTPMQRDFDGGFDLFMTGTGFFLLFMPIDQAFSLDTLRYKLQNPFKHYSQYIPSRVSILAYYIPVAVCLGFLYFDSAIHKLFAPHWRNGLGTWLPATQPYYISALDVSALLNIEWLQKIIGYTILIFQFTFIFFVQNRHCRSLFLIVGIGLHLGITLTLNIYPFGLGMLIFYVLLVPFSWWRKMGDIFIAKQPSLTIFYDEKCPLCNRTALTLNHFDIFQRLDFKGAQTDAKHAPPLNQYTEAELLLDLYAVDAQGKVYAGVATYAQILMHMRYMKWLGLCLMLPGIYTLACKQYRQIADNRKRIICDEHCIMPIPQQPVSFYDRLQQAPPKIFAHQLAKVLTVLFILQLNSTVHYALLYRLKVDMTSNPLTKIIAEASNASLLLTQGFVGITPHALYLHDHFEGYNDILAITYRDAKGQEQWLPFINQEGRLVAPNWGRVHSMWANIAVTPHINQDRLSKCTMKVTAFYAKQLGLNLNQTTFNIMHKKIEAPFTWVYDQRNKNLAGDWQAIGQATWRNQHFTLSLPALN